MKILFFFYQTIHDCYHWGLPISMYLLSMNTVLLRCGAEKGPRYWAQPVLLPLHVQLGGSLPEFAVWSLFALKLNPVMCLINALWLLYPFLCWCADRITVVRDT